MNPKKILIFSLQYYPFIGGAEVAIKEITDRISPEEIEFHMITLRYDANLPKVEQIGNVLVHRIGSVKKKVSIADLNKFPLRFNKYLYQIFAYLGARALHKRYHYDAVWAMMSHGAGIPAGLFRKKFSDVPYLLTLQEGDPLPHIEKMMKKVWGLFKNGFVRADYLQAISTFLLDWGKRMGFKGVAELIPNAVDTKRFAHPFTETERKVKAQELGKKEGEVWLVTISRLVHKNAVDTVIQALSDMPPSVVFVVGGIGPEKNKLHSLAKKCGVENRVRFLGEVSQADLPAVLSVCDIFVRPSRSEGMGISFIEAMASGLPTIGSNVGGIPDFLREGETGWVVEPEKPEQIVHAVNTILEHKEKTAEIAKRAQAMVVATYDWEEVGSRMKSLFEKMLQGR